jgi:diguanylate cyclase (GGDEF)-like protein/PAS domain S-box-containing protein
MLVTAAVYWALGAMAIQLAAPSELAAPLFPAAAVALVAALDGGAWGLAGAGLGAFILAAPLPLNAGTGPLLASVVVALAIMLQARVGAWALRRWVGWPQSLSDTPRILRFIAVATLSSLISASIAVPVLHWADRISEGWVSFSWWRWWMGGAVGILIGFPLIQILLPPDDEWRARRWKLGLPLTAALVLLALGVVVANRWEELRQRALFERDAEELRGHVRESLRTLDDVLDATQLFAAQSDEVTDEEFAAYARPWSRRVPDIIALGLVVQVAPEDRKRIESLQHEEGELDYRIFDFAADGARREPQAGAMTQVIFRIEPHAYNAPLLGLNLLSVPQLSSPLLGAIAGEDSAISESVQLPQQKAGERGVALYAPVAARAAPDPKIKLPRPSAAFIWARLDHLTDVPPRSGLHACVTETTASGSVLIAGGPRCDVPAGDGPRFAVQSVFPIGGRHWTLSVRADASYEATRRGQPNWLLPTFGWSSSALLLAFLLTSVGRTRRIEELVTRRTNELNASESRFRDMLERVELLALQLDSEGRITFCNASLCRLLGRDEEDVLGRSWIDHFVPEDRRQQARERFRTNMAGYIAPRGHVESVLLASDGDARLISWSVTLLRSHDQINGLACIGEDIGAQREAQQKLEETTALLSAAIEQSPSGIVIAEAPSLRMLMINSASHRMRGEEAEAGVNVVTDYENTGWWMYHPDGRPCAPHELPLVRAVADGEVTHNREYILRPPTGKERWITLNAAPVRNSRGEIIAGIVIFNDISELKDHQGHLERLAHFDSLTRLPNRTLLADRLSRAIEHTRRVGQPFAVAYLDLDGFKQVNDQHGHDKGDELLVEVAARLLECVRNEDTVARLGGDEFVLLLAQLAEPDAWRTAVNRILASLARPFDIHGESATISASIGVTLYPDDDSGPEVLLRHADQAMYIAKQAGRNRAYLFDPEHDRQTQTAHAQMARVERALEAGEFVLHYQPIVDMRLGLVKGVEALIRWQHPERGLLPPAAFLPLIENSPLAVRVGQWVLEAAIRQWLAWHEMGLNLRMNVNLSAEQLQDPDFGEGLKRTLNRYPDFAPERLEFELIETSALDDMPRVSAIMSRCAELGVAFAIDDFGTGYSSLSYFRRLPARGLKVDQSFIRDMLVDPEDLAIVEGVVRLAQVFRRDVTAEGVETVMHGALLLRLGCHRAQGYGIARPMPGDAVPDWIEHWRPDPIWSHPLERLRRENIPLLAAEIDHRSWIERFISAARAGDGSPLPPMELTDCRLGRWIENTVATRFETDEAFDAMCASHVSLHETASGIARTHETGGPVEELLAELQSRADDFVLRLRALWLPGADD